MILDNFKEEHSFWEYNPQFKIILKDFYSNDKSKNKDKSSKIAWAAALLVHPRSEFYNLPDKDIILARDFIKEKGFKWDDYKEVVDTIEDTILSQAEKSLVSWDKTLKKRDEFIHSQDFTLDDYNDDGRLVKGTADQLDKMLANTNKLYQEYFKIVKELKNEEEARSRGNRIKSLSDSGEI
jgi:hypothetical protein